MTNIILKEILVKYERRLEVFKDRKKEREMIEKLIRKKVSDNNKIIHILEAGCGRRWPYKLEGIPYVLTGVDIDKRALEMRKNTLADLDIAIEGDLTWINLDADKYDVIYCEFVLEHIKRADLVIKNFAKWVKPNGIIIIKIPDRNSVKGYITRITPFWFHIFFHRYILGSKFAGKPGYNPYKTYFHPIVSRSGLRDFCNENNNIDLEAEYGCCYRGPKSGLIIAMIKIFAKIISIISFGFLNCKHNDLLFILRKKDRVLKAAKSNRIDSALTIA
jgi:SAM-dependent methyltransferase